MKTVEDFPVPHLDVCTERKKRLESALRSSNGVLEACHARAKAEGYKGSRRAFFADLCRGTCEFRISREELDEIVRTKDMEWEVLCIHSKLIAKLARKWSRMLDASMSEEDVNSHAMEAFLDAVCSFTKEGSFSNYLYHSVSRHLSDLRLKNPMRIPREIIRIRSKLRGIMNRENVTLDSAVIGMGLTEKTERMLVASMSAVKDVDDVAVYDPEPSDETVLIRKIVESMEFSGLEKVVLEEFVRSGGETNMSELSRRTINPSTGKAYSKMAVSLAWRRVRDKIAQVRGRAA